MKALITLTDFLFDNLVSPLNISIIEGQKFCFVTSCDHETMELAKLLTGLKQPMAGIIRLFDSEPSTLSRHQILDARSEIGVIPASGGLISNLKLWENITLPFTFRHGNLPAETGEKALKYLELFEYKGTRMALPGHLSIFERRMVSFIRAAICSPKIMIYAGCLDSLSENEMAIFLDQTEALHKELSGLASIYLTSVTDLEKQILPDKTIHLRQETAHSWRKP